MQLYRSYMYEFTQTYTIISFKGGGRHKYKFIYAINNRA